MFDIGFSELLVIGIVALVVIGPERLPAVARTAGHLFGRLQRYVAGIKADIAREMELDELRKFKSEVENTARSFGSSIQEEISLAEQEIRALERQATGDAEEAASKPNSPTSETSRPTPLPEHEHSMGNDQPSQSPKQ